MKVSFVFFCLLLLASSARPQDNKVLKPQKAFVLITGGPSFPLGDYGSSDTTKSQAGFAKTGYNFELQGAWYFATSIGVTASVLYAKHNFDNSFFSGSVASADHWQYYGFLAGLLFSTPTVEHLTLDGSITFGITRVNSPRINDNGQAFLEEAWSTAVPLKLETDLRFHVGQHGQIIAGINYLYQDANFITTVLGSSTEFRQKMDVFGIKLGFGFAF